jgi:hypothetical protein
MGYTQQLYTETGGETKRMVLLLCVWEKKNTGCGRETGDYKTNNN